MSEFTFEGKKDQLILDHCLKLEGDAIVFGIFGMFFAYISIMKKAMTMRLFRCCYMVPFGSGLAKLSIVASTILKTINSLNYLQSQNRYKVHLETIELANVILIDCSNQLLLLSPFQLTISFFDGDVHGDIH